MLFRIGIQLSLMKSTKFGHPGYSGATVYYPQSHISTVIVVDNHPHPCPIPWGLKNCENCKLVTKNAILPVLGYWSIIPVICRLTVAKVLSHREHWKAKIANG